MVQQQRLGGHWRDPRKNLNATEIQTKGSEAVGRVAVESSNLWGVLAAGSTSKKALKRIAKDKARTRTQHEGQRPDVGLLEIFGSQGQTRP
jgi:hypothetical protein